MGELNSSEIFVTPIDKKFSPGGDVIPFLKFNEVGYRGFGEAYFSTINFGAVKAWKLHKKMTLNLIVPIGSVKFVFAVDAMKNIFREEVLGEGSLARLTVPPGIWFGFKGLGGVSLVLNIADIPHEPTEALTRSKEEFLYDWSLV